MDLNLYLGLPRSPMHRGTDLGSDLALGSIPLLSEEISTSPEMSVFLLPLDSHAPYSPTHASYTPTRNPMEPLDSQGIEIPLFDYSLYDPPTPYRLVPPLPLDESNGISRLEYSPYAAAYVPAPIATRQTSTDPSQPYNNDELGHVPYSPTYAPIATTEQDGSAPVVEDGTNHTEYVPTSPAYSPVPAAAPQQPNEGLVHENVDPYVPSSPSYVPISTTGQDVGQPVVEHGNNNVEFVLSSASYSPVREQINVGLMPEDVDPYVPSSPSYIPLMPATPGHANHTNNENLQPAGEVAQSQDTMRISEPFDPYFPSSPSYIPLMPATPGHANHTNDENLQPAGEVAQSQDTMRISEPLALEGPSQQRLLQPEFRFQRLIESSRRWRIGRFRSTAPYRADLDSGASSLNMEDRILQEVMASGRSIGTTGSPKVNAESLVSRNTDEEMKEQGSGATNFECNICLDMAREPVVTSCGHLFCWPCLFQWLYLHCDHKECPVCKGEVTESNVTPIYGRGSSESGVEKTRGEEGNSGLKVPPRPRGHRFESLRQQIRRPFSRRLGHEISSWRRIFDEELRNGNRLEGEDPHLQASTALSRLRAAHRFRREGNSENGLNLWSSGLSRNATETTSNSQNGNSLDVGHHEGSRSNSPFPEGMDFLQRLAFLSIPVLPSSERFAAFTAGLSSVMERVTNIVGHPGASASANHRDTEPLLDQLQGTGGATAGAEQASASSTMATIQGDVGVVNNSSEANAAGSSRSIRRRRRNGASSSLDVDGEVHHAHKRRRLN